ncbi:tRNA-dihydrouridine synthase family protein [Bdellovibrionota bacterium FG-1]
MNIGREEGPQIRRGTPAIILAPMEGVTDAPMRAFLTELGGFNFCVSEFLRISQDIPGLRTFREHVPELLCGARTSAGIPVHVQLLGGDPNKLALSAARACEAGAWGIDLNFGCPSPTVNGRDGGAALLKYPDRIRAIVSAVRAAVPPHMPVSVKLRLGWDAMDAIHLNADRAAEGGATWITIHGRTKEQGYRPPAYWGPIGEVNRRIGNSIPIIANGDIWSVEDFRRCQEQTGCEHFMLGRGALADPLLALRITSGVTTPDLDALTQPVTWVPWMKRWMEICAPYYDERQLAPRIKQWFGFVRTARPLPWWDEIKRRQSTQEIVEWLNS